MEIRHIECFKLAAEHGSTRRAAEHLYTSQSCVSKNIAMLEEELGVQLFERSNRGLTLTSQGRELYEHARSILHGLELFKAVHSRQTAQVLRIASYPSKMLSHYLCVLYNEMQERQGEQKNPREQEEKDARARNPKNGQACPPFTLTFLEGSISETMEYVERGLADLGFVYFYSAQARQFRHILGHKELVYTELSRNEPCIYVGPKNRFYDRESITFRELDACRFIQSTKDYFSIDHHIDSISLGMGNVSRLNNVITTNSDNLLIEMLLYTDVCNFGIRLLKDAYRIHAIRDIPIEGCGSCLSLGYIKRQKFQPGPEYERFIELIRTQLLADAAGSPNDSANGGATCPADRELQAQAG